MRLVFLVLALGLLALGLFGCGGGGGTSSVGTPMKLTINWPERSRTVEAPSSALSCKVTLSDPISGDPVQTWTINRPENAAANVQTWTSPSGVPIGNYTLTVTFYTETNAGGVVIAEATTAIVLQTDGSGAGTITPESTIVSVEVTAGQSVLVGEKKTLTFTAKDALDAVVAVTPGSAVWAVTSGADKLQFIDGDAEGLVVGTAQVTATVDGKTSAAMTIEVESSSPEWVEKILFNIEGPDNDLYMVNPDGSELIKLTSTPDIEELGAALSPSGTKIAYILYNNITNGRHIAVMNTDGTESTIIYTNNNNLYDNPVTWSPDGAKIAFTEAGGIFTINADGSGKTLVTSEGHTPSWSPDGQSIVFESRDDTDSNVAIVSVDGTNRRLVTNFTNNDLWFGPASWSSQNLIVLTYSDLDDAGIYQINPDGTRLIKLVDGKQPSWNPDGNAIVYEAVNTEYATISIREANGTISNVYTRTGESYYGFTGISWGKVRVDSN